MIVIMGDTHGDLKRFDHKAVKKLKKKDFLIILGDFGFMWNGSDEENKIIKSIGKKRFKTLFIDGTHENFDLLDRYPKENSFGGKVKQIYHNLYYICRGSVIYIDGKRIFALGGGESTDFDMRREDVTWWKRELPSTDELKIAADNLKACNMEVDYIVTHDACGYDKGFINLNDRYRNHLHAFLDGVNDNCKYKAWYFGCYHLDKNFSPRHRCVFKEPIVIE